MYFWPGVALTPESTSLTLAFGVSRVKRYHYRVGRLQTYVGQYTED